MGSLVLKLLFKAMVPLALVLGAMSYASYLRGGDPGAVLGAVGAGIGERFAVLGRDARDGAERAAGAVTGLGDASDGLTEVRTWVDADGLVHYSNAGDVPAGARLLRIDPDTNVLAPLPVAPARPAEALGRASAASGPTPTGTPAGDAPAAALPGAPMPGVAGMFGGAGADVDPERAAELLRLLRAR